MAKKGRPSLFSETHGLTQSSEESIINIFNNANDFKNEKEMCDYIELNIVLFCKDFLNDKYIGHAREFKLSSNTFRNGACTRKDENNTRIDFFIRGKKRLYFVEVKNPIQIQTELTRAVGQLALYQYLINKKDIPAELVVVSSKYNDIFYKLIKKHSVDCKYMLLNKNQSAFIGELQEVCYG